MSIITEEMLELDVAAHIEEHNHRCLACGEVMSGVKCDAEIKYCDPCLLLPRYERILLTHLFAIGNFTNETREAVSYIADVMAAHLSHGDDSPEAETVQ